MILIEDFYVLDEECEVGIWKNALFTKEEAEKEKVAAEKETCKKYTIMKLDDYFTELNYAWY